MHPERRTLSRHRVLVAALGSVLLLSACVVATEPRYVGETVYVAPPPDRVEEIGTPPVAGYVWITGYWGWVGGRHEWVPGRWEQPRRGYTWVPHRWVQVERGWRLQEGHWERHR